MFEKRSFARPEWYLNANLLSPSVVVDKSDKLENVSELKGMGSITAKAFVDNIDEILYNSNIFGVFSCSSIFNFLSLSL